MTKPHEGNTQIAAQSSILEYPKAEGEDGVHFADQRDWWKDRCRELLEEFTEFTHWSGYASEYFQKKHDLASDMARLDALRKAIEGAVGK